MNLILPLRRAILLTVGMYSTNIQLHYVKKLRRNVFLEFHCSHVLGKLNLHNSAGWRAFFQFFFCPPLVHMIFLEKWQNNSHQCFFPIDHSHRTFRGDPVPVPEFRFPVLRQNHRLKLFLKMLKLFLKMKIINVCCKRNFQTQTPCPAQPGTPSNLTPEEQIWVDLWSSFTNHQGQLKTTKSDPSYSSEIPSVLLGIPWPALRGLLRIHLWKKGVPGHTEVERILEMLHMPWIIGFWGFPAVLSRGIPGNALRAFPGSFRNFPEFLPENPSRTGGMA